MDDYTYEQYAALHAALGGTTTHFRPAVGTRRWHHSLLGREEFERKLARLREIETHDDAWLDEHINDPHIIDQCESETWESLDLRSELLLIEVERAAKAQAAMQA